MDSNDKRTELLATLGTEVQKLTTSEGWLAWLDAASRFHDYSVNNQLLIVLQRPAATRVAGYRVWQSLGRQVRKGETGISILAPCFSKREDPDTGEVSRVVCGFKVVYVFDVAQTDGNPLPERAMPKVGASDCGVYGDLVACARFLGMNVETVPTCTNGARGWWHSATRTITIVESYSLASRTRTMLHELSHALDPQCQSGSDRGTRAERELVAESAAYLVGTSLGLDIVDASTFYVASWGGDSQVLAGIATKTLAVADALTDALTASLGLRAVA